MAIETCRVQSPADWNDFFAVGRRVYKDDPHWVPPLEPEVRRLLNARRNPFFRHASLDLFLVRRDGQPMARASLVVDQQSRQPSVAFLGFFECVDDSSVAAELFRGIDQSCMAHGVRRIQGPFNPNLLGEIGLQTSGFDSPPTYFQTYNPTYYVRLFEEAGFREIHRVCTATCRHFSESIQKRFGFTTLDPSFPGYRVRGINLLKLGRELETLRSLLNDAFAENWGFQPASREEYAFVARSSRLAAHRDLVSIVELNGRPIAALVCALNINPLIKKLDGRFSLWDRFQLWRRKSSVRHLMVFEIGVRPGARGWPLGLILLQTLARMARGFEVLETTWMSQSEGQAARLAKWAGFEEQKAFAVYERAVPANPT